ncbi:cell division protein FtsZ [Photobacterium swingsii]|uniref:Cell division protein FtsZ n=1 Tax=Photobacterium swingsii TaxID=680026 RepID=A0A0J8Y4C5_9GAMM|nr:SulA-like leucine-rich domain-containing protein [Photobacterium swingsii]KMV32329.1 cell division protein FtsZ [Photobacterium swingsii]PSW27176.1 cell division protein FtsZ [Photobacterium swingsii]
MAELFESQHSVSVSQAYKSTYSSLQGTPLSIAQSVSCPIEVTFSDEHQAQLAYFLRLLKQANLENRWIMFISHDALLDKKLLTNAGINLSKVLVLHKTKGKPLACLMEKALISGNCSAVIATGDIELFQTAAIRQAAHEGKSLAFVINKEQAQQRITFH